MLRHTDPALGIMIWDGIGYHSRTPLVRIAGTLNSQRYISEIIPTAASPDQLWRRVEASWSSVPQEDIQSLFESMPRRVAEAVGSLVVRAPGSGPEGLGSMPVSPNTLRVHTEYLLVKLVGPKVLWAESRVQGTGEHFPPLQFHAKIVELEIDGGAFYHTFGNFTALNRTVTCMMLNAKANDRRTSNTLPR
ncbi:transposable element Tcb1 transposase [Trichonephila clavipes]|nr:transposable element Tcb1 transposase [Trichonephila clavipes]